MRIRVICCVICALLMTINLIILVPRYVDAQVTEEWVRRYNGTGNYVDKAVAIVADGDGNIYVTGESKELGTYSDYTTIAYDSFGNTQWIAKYSSPGNDRAAAMTVDTYGNVIVTGTSWGDFSTYDDYATVKYDSNGNELWVARYNGLGNYRDEPRAIITDPQGNVYVTGISNDKQPPGPTSFDIATVKYDPDGNELWVARYIGSDSYSYAIALDNYGNIYVTGHSWVNITNNYDYITIAYNSTGSELWTSRYDGTGSYGNYDEATDMAVDSANEIIYVAGRSDGNGSLFDFVTVAYDFSGNELWVDSYNGPGNGHDGAKSMVLDDSGNLYVTGWSLGNGTDLDYATIKYDKNGNRHWIARYDGPGNGEDKPSSIAINPSGYIYVTGGSYNISIYNDCDFATVAYDFDGNELWVARYDSLWVSDEMANDITVDPFGNVYVTGSEFSDPFAGDSADDYITIKYSQQTTQEVAIDIDPNTLNLKSKGRWITCYITLNDPYDVSDIDISTILLEDTIPAEWGDIQGDTLMVKFDRSEVEDMLPVGTYNLKVTGELTDGTSFEGYSDEIRVIDPGK